MTDSTSPRKRYYLLHRWTGLSLALLGMLVFFSGAVATYHEELDAWAQRARPYPSLREVPGFDLDRAYAAAARHAPPEFRHEVFISQAPHQPLHFFFHRHEANGKEEGFGVALDPASLQALSVRSGDRQEALEPSAPASLARFFIDLHIFLLLPDTLGLVATGIVGFALMILVTTGVLVHRPTWAKLTRVPRLRNVRSATGDLHTLVGSWSLPYTLLLSLTGSFFSFASSVLIPVVALVAFGGNMQELERKALGKVEVVAGPGEAQLEPIRRDAFSRSAAATWRGIGLEDWGDAKASATVFFSVRHAFGNRSEHLVYDGHSGAFLQTKPSFGSRASLGDSLVSLMADLHFGTLFGGVTKALWSVLGLGTTALAATGLWVFVARRREGQATSSRVVRGLTVALVAGLPLASGVSFVTWLAGVALGVGTLQPAIAASFLCALALAGALGFVTTLERALVFAWLVSGMMLLALPFAAHGLLGPGFVATWQHAELRSTLGVDATLLVLGALLLLGALALRRRATKQPLLLPSSASLDPEKAGLPAPDVG